MTRISVKILLLIELVIELNHFDYNSCLEIVKMKITQCPTRALECRLQIEVEVIFERHSNWERVDFLRIISGDLSPKARRIIRWSASSLQHKGFARVCVCVAGVPWVNIFSSWRNDRHSSSTPRAPDVSILSLSLPVSWPTQHNTLRWHRYRAHTYAASQNAWLVSCAGW